MGETKRVTPGKTPKNKAVKLRTEEEEETPQESTRNKGQAAMQISIEVERNEYADQTGVEKAEVDQKVAEAAEPNEINREDKSTDPKISEKMVSAKKNRKRNAAKLLAGPENTGSIAAGTVDVDRFTGEQKSTLDVADESTNEEILAEEYVQGEQKKKVIVDSNQIVGKSEQKCVPKAELETESPQTVKKILEVAKAEESAAKTPELQQNESEKEIEVTMKTKTQQKLSEKMEIDEMVEKTVENEQKKRKRAKKVKEGEGKSEQANAPKAELEMESPQTVKTILEVAKADESAAKTLKLQQIESEKEIEGTVKTETEEKLSEKMEIDEMVEKKIENEQSEDKCKKSKKRKRAKKVKEGEGKPEQENVPKAKLEMDSILEVAKVDESTVKKVELQQYESEKEIEVTVKTATEQKVELQQNESEKEIEVTVKTETEQKVSEKMEIDEMVEKKIENEQSEGNCKKSKKRKRAKKIKGGEGKSEQETVTKAKLEMESPQTVTKILEVAKADESTANKVELQQNESEKEIEVTVTEQRLSKKIEIDEMVEKKIENEQSEGKRKKGKKRKRAKKVGGELKKITEEEGEVKKNAQEQGEVKTTKVDGVVEKNPQDDHSEAKRKKNKKKKRKKKEKGGEMKKITEGDVKKSIHEEGEVKTMNVDGTVEKNPENDQSKSKKRNGANIEEGGQLKKTRQEETATEEQQQCNAIEVIEMLVDSLTKDELLEVVKSTALKEVGFSAHVDRVASRDELKRTICIESLSHSTNSEMLREAFLQYGQIEKANVVVHKDSGHSRGFGFVVFTTKSSALSAVRHPVQKINGRLSHCSLANDQRNRSHNSYTGIPRPGKYVNPATHGPGGFANPTMLASGEYVDPLVFGPRVNSTFSGHLYPQAAMGDFQSPNQWGYSDLHNEYSDSQYNGNNHVKRCGCGSIYCDL